MITRRDTFKLLCGAAVAPLVAQLPPVDMIAAENFVKKKIYGWRLAFGIVQTQDGVITANLREYEPITDPNEVPNSTDGFMYLPSEALRAS